MADIGRMTNQSKAIDNNLKYEQKSVEVEKLEKELADVKQELAETKMTRKSEGQALLEIEHLRADNDRLIKLLKKTKDYKKFANFAEDNQGSVRYMPNSKKKR